MKPFIFILTVCCISLCSNAQHPVANLVDSITYEKLVVPTSWEQVLSDDNYVFQPIDTTIGSGKTVNAVLIHSGNRIAYGNLKDDQPHGWWGLVSNDNSNEIVIAGFFKKGKKTNTWWTIDCWLIYYNRKTIKKMTHSAFGC